MSIICVCLHALHGHFLSFFSTFLFTLSLLWHISGQEVTKQVQPSEQIIHSQTQWESKSAMINWFYSTVKQSLR